MRVCVCVNNLQQAEICKTDSNQNAQQYLERHLTNITDVYQLSIVTYGLQLVGSSESTKALNLLNQRKIQGKYTPHVSIIRTVSMTTSNETKALAFYLGQIRSQMTRKWHFNPMLASMFFVTFDRESCEEFAINNVWRALMADSSQLDWSNDIKIPSSQYFLE